MADPNDYNSPDPFNENNGAPDENESLETGVPEVATSPRRAMLVLLLLVAGVGFILYLLFSGDEEEVVAQKTETPISANDPQLAPPPVVPDSPIATPLPPPPVDVVAEPPAPPSVDIAMPPATPEPTDDERQARLKSAMLITNTEKGGGDQGAKSRANAALAGNDPNTAFAQNSIAASEADKAEAMRIEGDLNTTIAQGKIIDAVLETAINTDLPGSLRAIVSRDIYPESGRLKLIPKGSRLIGTYNPGILRGQKRVFVIWNRVIRPDGIDVMINSPGIDNLGRAGIGGYVDNKYMEVFSGAVLTSAITIGAAIGADKALGDDNQVQTTTDPNGSVTQTGTAGALATSDAITNAGSIAKGVISGMLDLRPTITVDQGVKVNVFVNRDLVFPPEIANRAHLLP